MADASAEPNPWLSGLRLRVVFALLAVALTTLSVWVGFLVYWTSRDSTTQSDISAVQEVAARTATSYFSISYQTFDQDYQRFMADMDHTMKTQAAQGSTQVKQTVTQNKLISKGTLFWVGVTAVAPPVAPNTATVVVTVNRTAQSAQVTTPQMGYGRFQIDLSKTHGRWLVSNIKQVQ